MADGLIDVKIDGRMVKELEGYLQRFPDRAPGLAADALNRAGTAGRMAMVDRIAQTHFVEESAVKKTVKITTASASRLSVHIRSIGAVLRLGNFNVTQGLDRLVHVQILRGGAAKPWRHAFTGRMQNVTKGGKFAVYTRVGKERLPIKQEMGPAIPSMLHKEEDQAHVEFIAQGTFLDRLMRGFDLLEKSK